MERNNNIVKILRSTYGRIEIRIIIHIFVANEQKCIIRSYLKKINYILIMANTTSCLATVLGLQQNLIFSAIWTKYIEQTEEMKERIAFVDYIRVIACLLVMVVHASEQFYNMGPISQVVNEDNRLWVSVYDGFFGRISVPLFMIVSAFLLVPMK